MAGDVKPFELRDAPYPTIYFDMFQVNHLFDQFQLRTSSDPAAMAETVRRMAREVLTDVPVKRVTTLAAQVDSNIVPERLIATLSEFFGGLGAALAGIGIYGLLAYSVARRTNEIGVRMALGATTGDVSRLVLGDALGMLCAGLVAGALLVLWGQAAGSQPDPGSETGERRPAGFGRWGNCGGRAAGLVCPDAASNSRGPNGSAAP